MAERLTRYKLFQSNIWGFHTGEDKICSFLGCCTV